MTRHPATEGNELRPADVLIPDPAGPGRVSLAEVVGGDLEASVVVFQDEEPDSESVVWVDTSDGDTAKIWSPDVGEWVSLGVSDYDELDNLPDAKPKEVASGSANSSGFDGSNVGWGIQSDGSETQHIVMYNDEGDSANIFEIESGSDEYYFVSLSSTGAIANNRPYKIYEV